MLSAVFPLLLLIVCFVFNFHHFDYYVSWCVPPWVYPSWDSLCFLDLVDYFLSHIFLDLSAIISSNIFWSPLSSFWDPYNANVGAFNVVPEVF